MIDMISLHPQELGATTVQQNCTKKGLQVSVDHYCAERARFRGAALAASRCPPGGSFSFWLKICLMDTRKGVFRSFAFALMSL